MSIGNGYLFPSGELSACLLSYDIRYINLLYNTLRGLVSNRNKTASCITTIVAEIGKAMVPNSDESLQYFYVYKITLIYNSHVKGMILGQSFFFYKLPSRITGAFFPRKKRRTTSRTATSTWLYDLSEIRPNKKKQ